MNRSASSAVAVWFALLGIGCSSTPLALPGPILGLDDEHATRSAILEGMARRGWILEQESDGSVLARLERRTHVAKVWVDYSGKQIEFRYGGSEQLGCKPQGDSCRSIHVNYNRWVRNLAADISRVLTMRRSMEAR